jgi:hypothetical protein
MVSRALFALSDRFDEALRRVTGRPPKPPRFDGLMRELFALWPLEAGDCPLWMGGPDCERACPWGCQIAARRPSSM